MTTHQQHLERSIRTLGDIWDTTRAVTTLRAAGHEVTDKRARQVLRDIAATGLIVKTDPVRAVYRTIEQ
ncbi:hypothetical protein HCJ76_00225 [Streptomyces sp. MC1]|uniref:hypothetical protein n=1 Tax=Streptomyces TaxID=1883 RepID=UPI0018C8F58F|nr:hypothetical protein [Streptomyces sp. MC1]MBG7696572.1 hypothetical protein [Streptomyces sp. MC1]